MTILLASFGAGFLTVLAPCILPLLPVILTGAITERDRKSRLLAITLGLIFSVVTFSLLLKATTLLLGVPQVTWQIISGVIIALFGAAMLLPEWWERASISLSARAAKSLQSTRSSRGLWGDFLLGAALGPVFNSCSPTYALVVAAILPTSFITGFGYLVAYALGLAIALLLVALLGRALVSRLGWAVNPEGWFRKLVGLLLIVIGLAIIFGLDKEFQAYVLEQGYYDPIIQFEERLRLSK